MGLIAVLVVVLVLTMVALCVAVWFDGYAEGMADAVEPMTEWYRHHMGDSEAICGNESRITDKYSRNTETRR